MVEKKTIKKAVKGNKKAFEQLIKMVSHEGYRLAYYYLKHESDSQDALGSAIEKAYKSIHKLNDQDKFKSWFMTIVVNEAKMILRKKANAKIISLEEVMIFQEKENNYESLLDLKKALSNLKEDDRMILMMKYYEGYTFKEVGLILEMSESTVKTRHYTLLDKLKKELAVKEKAYVKQS